MGNSKLNDGQRQQLRALVDEMRRSIDYVSSVNTDEAELAALAEQARVLADALQPLSGDKALEHYNADWGDDLNNLLPSSPFTGRFNPLAPPVEMSTEGERVLGRVTFNRAYEGPPDCVHGGMVAAVYDQLLAAASVVGKAPGPTATLTIDFLAPTPLYQPLEFSAWIERREGKKVFICGECHHDGMLVSRCNGLFIQYFPQS